MELIQGARDSREVERSRRAGPRRVNGGLFELHKVLTQAGVIWRARFSPDGTLIVSAPADGTARVWRTDGTILRTLQHPYGVTATAASERGAARSPTCMNHKRLVSAGSLLLSSRQRAAFELHGYYYFEQEDEVKGLYWLETAVTLQDPDALCEIGQIRLYEGRYEEALKYLNEGSKLAHKRGPGTREHCESWLKETQRHLTAATPTLSQ
jgi:hypothetical protein